MTGPLALEATALPTEPQLLPNGPILLQDLEKYRPICKIEKSLSKN